LFFARGKKIAFLQKLFLPVSEIFSHDAVWQGVLSTLHLFVSNKLALLSKSTSSREIPRYTNIAVAGVTYVQKVLREFIFAGVQ